MRAKSEINFEQLTIVGEIVTGRNTIAVKGWSLGQTMEVLNNERARAKSVDAYLRGDIHITISQVAAEGNLMREAFRANVERILNIQ